VPSRGRTINAALGRRDRVANRTHRALSANPRSSPPAHAVKAPHAGGARRPVAAARSLRRAVIRVWRRVV